MRILVHEDATRFLKAADQFLLADPFTTSVICVVAQRIAEAASQRTDCLWITIEDDSGHVLGVAMHTPPFPLFLSRMPLDAAVALAHSLLDSEHELPGVNGICEANAAFAEAWTARTGQSATVVHAMRMYSLGSLRPPQDVSGRAALATTGDGALLVDWFERFQEEALPHAPAEDQAETVARRIAAGELHLWCDGGRPVSVAAVTAPVAGVARVGPVYTPPGARRHGYGAAVTAAASAAARAAGAKHLVLYADLANPTSNAIYQAIGYRPNHDGESRLFQAPSAAHQAAEMAS